MRKLGLLGGTFDPVHRGHLQLAQFAIELCDLDNVIFIPTFHPPHKDVRELTSFEHRVNMLKLAVARDDRFSISIVEKNLKPPTYTIDMLMHFYEKCKDTCSFYFIIGVDAFLEISSWKNFHRVMESTHFIVSARQGYSAQKLFSLLASFKYTEHAAFWLSASGKFRIYYLDIETIDASSSAIRKNIVEDNLPNRLLLDPVSKYIKTHRLYK